MKLAKQIYDSNQANRDVQRKLEAIDNAGLEPEETKKLKKALFQKQLGIYPEKQDDVNSTQEVIPPDNADNVKYKNNKQGVELEYSLPKNLTTEKKPDGSIVTEQTTTPPEIRSNIENQNNSTDDIRESIKNLISENISVIEDSENKNFNI
jgi:hypothetical protein